MRVDGKNLKNAQQRFDNVDDGKKPIWKNLTESVNKINDHNVLNEINYDFFSSFLLCLLYLLLVGWLLVLL